MYRQLLKLFFLFLVSILLVVTGLAGFGVIKAKNNDMVNVSAIVLENITYTQNKDTIMISTNYEQGLSFLTQKSNIQSSDPTQKVISLAEIIKENSVLTANY